jgi:hypothetical protein
LCPERLDDTLDQFEKHLSDSFDRMNARLKGIEYRLMHQADN